MKKLIAITACFTLFSLWGSAQEVKKLPQPDMNINVSITEAMQKRRSYRDYQSKPVTDQQISNLLWAACGINNPERGLLTIPTATNAQDIQAYLCSEKGVSIYNPKENTLTEVTKKDIRPILCERQSAMAVAPAFILLVSDLSKFRGNAEHYGAMDAGYASQNICLMCAALGLKTVPRAMMNYEEVKKELNLPETTALELNHPIGY